MTTLNHKTGPILAALMSALRESSGYARWDVPGCEAALRKVAHLDAGNVAVAAIRLALTPEANTPGALANLQGQHWRERISERRNLYPPKRHESCPQHPGEWPETCRCCASETLADTGDDPRPPRPPAVPDVSARIAALKATARAASLPAPDPSQLVEEA